MIDLSISPLNGETAFELFLVVFETRTPEQSTQNEPKKGTLKGSKDSKIRKLEEDLQSTREYLQATIEELETANLTAAALLCWQRSALVGRAFSQFVLKEDQDAWFLHRRRILETGNSQPFQLRLRKNALPSRFSSCLFPCHHPSRRAQQDGSSQIR